MRNCRCRRRHGVYRSDGTSAGRRDRVEPARTIRTLVADDGGVLGRQGDLRAIKWYIVPDARSVDDRGKRVQGVTIGDRIVLADAFTGDGPLVRHEVRRTHCSEESTVTRREAFLVACNDIVVCDSTCAADAGGRPTPPPTDAPVLLPRDVAIRVEVVPQRPAASQDGGAVAVIVSITISRDAGVGPARADRVGRRDWRHLRSGDR